MTSQTQLHIRPARAADRAAIFAMVSTIWGGNDYIPDVWDEWLADSSGPLLVGELNGRPLALAKLSALGPREDWFHGLRVDPQARGQGYARALLRHCIALSQARAARTLRYMTDEDNPTMHRIGEELGFTLAYKPRWYRAPAISEQPRAVALPAVRLGALLDNLSDSELLARTAGLYSYAWRTFELIPTRLQAHLARGELLALPRESAWAIVVPDDDAVSLAHIEGAPPAIERLAHALRANTSASDDYAHALLPANARCIPALLAAGFAAPEDDGERVYELRFG